MIDFLKFFLLPLLAALGWWIGSRSSRLGHLLNRYAALAVLALWLLDSVTGIFAGATSVHRVLAHAAVAAAWLAAPLAVGLFLQEAIATGDNGCGLGALAALLVIPAALLTAATGYLGPSHAATTAHPLRFAILHLLAGPGLAAAFMVVWLLCARRISLDN